MYSYSLWLVFDPPQELTNLLQEHNLRPHIPHVTVETNIETFDKAMCRRRRMSAKDVISVDSMPLTFPSHYDNDPLHAWGYNVVLQNNRTEHEPHITIEYSAVPFEGCPDDFLSFNVDARLEVATTHSAAPEEWMVLTAPLHPVN